MTANIAVVYPTAVASMTYSTVSPCFQPLRVSMGQRVASTTPSRRLVGLRLAMAIGVAPSDSTIFADNPVARTELLEVGDDRTPFLLARMPGSVRVHVERFDIGQLGGLVLLDHRVGDARGRHAIGIADRQVKTLDESGTVRA